jgi:hypothetical protein
MFLFDVDVAISLYFISIGKNTLNNRIIIYFRFGIFSNGCLGLSIPFLSIPNPFPERWCGQKQENCGKFWVGHFVFFLYKMLAGDLPLLFCCAAGNAVREYEHGIASRAKRLLVTDNQFHHLEVYIFSTCQCLCSPLFSLHTFEWIKPCIPNKLVQNDKNF